MTYLGTQNAASLTFCKGGQDPDYVHLFFIAVEGDIYVHMHMAVQRIYCHVLAHRGIFSCILSHVQLPIFFSHSLSVVLLATQTCQPNQFVWGA